MEAVSISAFAKATGVPAETLRSWERRYGQPVPLRLPSGHRRYRVEDIQRIRLIAGLIESGRRPSELLRASLDELASATPAPPPVDPTVARWIELGTRFRSDALREELTAAKRELGPVPFLIQRIGPFLRQVGEAWQSGRWTVGQEACASEVVSQVLHELSADVCACRAVDSPARVVAASLPGEDHGLAVQMLEIVSRDAGAETWSLGRSCPIDSIAQAAAQTGATHLLIHVSAANAGIHVDQSLQKLLHALEAHRDIPAPEIIAGGAGAIRNRRGVRGVTYLNDLAELRDRLAAWNVER